MAQRPKTAFEIECTGRESRAKTAPEFQGGRPKCPRHLSAAARAEWRRCVRLMENRKTVTEGDFALLAVYAEVFARWVAAKTEMGDQLIVEETVLTSNGAPIVKRKTNPLLKIVENCEREIKSIAEKLGLTPITRARVNPTTGSVDAPPAPGTAGALYPHLFK